MAMEKHAMYKCTGEDCTVQMEMVYPCGCDTECQITCGENPMQKLEEQTADASTEKHVPVIEKSEGGYKVTVGSTLHPMKEEHWIQWIELRCDECEMVMRKYLHPGDEPVAFFPFSGDAPGKLTAREHCNVHNLWRGEGP